MLHGAPGHGAPMSWHKADAQAIASHAYAIDNIITRKFPLNAHSRHPNRNNSDRAPTMSADIASSSAAEITSSAPRRKSGRVPTQRQLYSPTGSAKRKRDNAHDSDADDTSPASDEDESESSPDEEELKERRKQTRKKKSALAQKKPPQKKPKTNGEMPGLAIRPAPAARKQAARPRKPPIRKSALVEQDADGLYGRSCPLGSARRTCACVCAAG